MKMRRMKLQYMSRRGEPNKGKKGILTKRVNEYGTGLISEK